MSKFTTFLLSAKTRVRATKILHNKTNRLAVLAAGIVAVVLLPIFGDMAVGAIMGPSIPTGLKSTATTATSVNLTWTSSVSANGIKNYTIYRNGTKIATVTTNKYLNTGLKPLTTYSYTVSATDQKLLVSAQSAPLKVTTLAAPPTALKATKITQTGVSLSWTASINATQLTGYYVYRNGTKIATVPKTTLTYTSTGLSAGVLYNYSVKGYYGTGLLTTPASLSVKTLPPILISTCSDITAPGYYQLSANLLATSGNSCLNIHDTNNVQLDCKNFKVMSSAWNDILTIENVNTFTLANCFVSLQDTTHTAANSLLQIGNSSYGTLQNNTFTGGLTVNANNVNHMTIQNNTFTNAMYQQIGGSYNNFANNTLSWVNFFGPFLISMNQGTYNKITGNTMDGHGGGTYGTTAYGMDDGIIVQRQTYATISGNSMVNLYDCGIETLWYVNNSTITNNTVNSASQCGIGGWYGLNFRNNVVSYNKANNTIYLFMFYRLYNLDPSETGVYFDNNQFIGNVITNGTSYNKWSAFFNLTSNANIPQNLVISQNNLFKNNNLGTLIEPYAFPGTTLVDGGGNICGGVNTSIGTHIVCH